MIKKSKTFVNKGYALEHQLSNNATDRMLLDSSTPFDLNLKLDLGDKLIKLDLYLMGFDRKMVAALLENEDVEDTN